MIYLNDENDYDTDEENSKHNYIEKLNHYEYSTKISIINYYKNLLMFEPEFIGIKNISSGEILKIIQQTKNIEKINYKQYKKRYHLNYDQYYIFNNLYYDLELECNINIFNTVTNKIFRKIYVNY
tara:strand:- start:624 stop:998 length:375 start_codon:yes stop_codon:yes gene_type:complete